MFSNVARPRTRLEWVSSAQRMLCSVVGFFFLVGACNSNPTEIMVRVDSDIATAATGGPLSRVTITASRDGFEIRPHASIDFSPPSQFRLPGDRRLLTANDSDTRPFRVIVMGYFDRGDPIRREYEVAFVPHQRRLLRVFLADRCRPGRCEGQPADCVAPEVCGPNETCGATVCEPIAPATLAEAIPLDLEDAAARRGECSPAETRPCYDGPRETASHLPCRSGVQTCDESGHWRNACEGQVLPATGGATGNGESCNDIDDNCNGQVDEQCECVPPLVENTTCYDASVATNLVGVCHGARRVCTSAGRWSACDGQVTPRALTPVEADPCNGYDDDCDGLVDENNIDDSCLIMGRMVRYPRCLDGIVRRCPPTNCSGRVCGTDADGTSCGICALSEVCSPEGRCVAPGCSDWQCGFGDGGVACNTLGRSPGQTAGDTGNDGCPPGERCVPETHRCVPRLGGADSARPDGASNQTVSCGGWWCPTYSICGGAIGSCECDPNTTAVLCATGMPATGAVQLPEVCCSHGALYCGHGVQLCAGGRRCPAHARCGDCSCLAGYRAVRCAGVPCQRDCGDGYYCALDE